MDIKRLNSLQSSQVSKLSNIEGGKTNSSSNNESAKKSDTIQFTEAAQDLKQAFAKLETVPVVNADRIKAARDAISEGSYTVDAEEIAKKMIQIEESFSDL